MNVLALLDELRRRRIELVPDGEGLRYRAPRGALTPNLRETLRSHKAELLAALRRRLRHQYEVLAWSELVENYRWAVPWILDNRAENFSALKDCDSRLARLERRGDEAGFLAELARLREILEAGVATARAAGIFSVGGKAPLN